MNKTSYQPACAEGLPADYGTDPRRPWERRPGDGARRPWTVTVASLIAFAFGFLKIFAVVLTVDVLKHWNLVQSHTTFPRGHFYFELLIALVFGLSLLWGGFAAWRGLDARALFVSAAGLVSYHMLWPMVVGAGHAGYVLSGYDLALLIVALLATRSSRDYFRARTGTVPESASRRA
jgi:hypothetical protein